MATKSKPEQTQWRFTFVAMADTIPAECRARQLLKVALRRFGLRCVSADGGDAGKPQPLAPSQAEPPLSGH